MFGRNKLCISEKNSLTIRSYLSLEIESIKIYSPSVAYGEGGDGGEGRDGGEGGEAADDGSGEEGEDRGMGTGGEAPDLEIIKLIRLCTES